MQSRTGIDVLEGMRKEETGVLSRQPMRELTATFVAHKGYSTTHFDMDSVEAVGLVKMDILAQGGLAAMRDVKSMLLERGIEIDVDRCVARDRQSGNILLGDPQAVEPWQDPKVWEMIAGGNARAVQGLETLDHRADVWALAAIAYECLTGEVPFKGNNGPAILLEILTKNPRPPSELSRDGHFPIAPGLDAVMARAFQKNANHRIFSVGQLADQVGYAYGLEESHKEWATRTQQDLESAIVANLPRLMAQQKSRDIAVDSFFGAADDLGSLPDFGNRSNAQDGVLLKGPTSSVPQLATLGSRWPIVAVIVATTMLAVMAAILLFVL